MLDVKKIAFIGSGVMGEAIIKGLLDKALITPESIVAADPWPPRRELMQERYATAVTDDNAAAVEGADIVMLSIKPQTLDAAAAAVAGKIRPDALVISIMAGTRIRSLQKALRHERIVRAMPNTPAQLGKGVTVWMPTAAVSEAQLNQTESILGALGEQLMVHQEHYLDMATGLSGSGPGFVFLMIEAMIDAGVQMGFARGDAETMVLQTIDGSVQLVRETGAHPAVLRNRVTSPGGTTAAGLFELEQSAMRAVLSRAVFAAYRRSEELGNQSEKRDAE